MKITRDYTEHPKWGWLKERIAIESVATVFRIIAGAVVYLIFFR